MSSLSALDHFESYRPGSGVAATAVVAGVVLGLEVLAPHLRKNTSGTYINGEAGETYAFDGLRCANADTLKQLLEPTIGPVDSIHYSPKEGVSSDSIAEALRIRFQKKGYQRPINLIGRSLGLVAGLAGLEQCARNGVPVPPINSIRGISSPRDYLDVKNGDKYRHLPIIAGRVGGFLTKVTGVIVTDLWSSDDRLKDLFQCVDYLISHYGDIQSPKQWSTHLKMAYTASQLRFDSLVECGALTPETQVVLAYERDDTVVKAPQAAARWCAELAAFGISVDVQMGESNRHADMSKVNPTFWHSNTKVYSTN